MSAVCLVLLRVLNFLSTQIARAKAVKAEFIKQAEHHAKEGRKVADVLADGVIVGVGLIQRDQGEEVKHK
jgi:NADH dehydrogenase (ubiquinone) Fe-S protein 5